MLSRSKTMTDDLYGVLQQVFLLVSAILLIGTTLLNIAFSLAPQTMTALLLGLLA